MAQEVAQPERGDDDSRSLCRSIDVELRVLNEEERTIEVIASSEALDSHGDVIKQFWDFSRYEKNPVVLWNHNRFGVSPYAYEGALRPEDLFPIGQTISFKVVAKKLVMTVKLASAEYSAIAQKVFLGCKEKVVRAVSVGFRPGNVNAIKDKAGHTVRYELGSEQFPNVLHELSFVPMGSNPDAVAKSIASDRKYLDRIHAAQESTTARGAKESTVNEEQIKAAHAAEIKTAMDLATGAETRATTAETQLKSANESLATERARATALDADLKAEKAASAKLEADLKLARDREDVLKAAQIDTTIKTYVGKKLSPPELDEYVALAKEIGLERVEKMIAGRPDLAVTTPVLVNGEVIKTSQVTPPSTERSQGSGSAMLDHVNKN